MRIFCLIVIKFICGSVSFHISYKILFSGTKVAESNKRESYFLILSNVSSFSVVFTGSLQVFCKAANLSNRAFCDGCIWFCSLPVTHSPIATLKPPEYLKTHLALEVHFYGNMSIYDGHQGQKSMAQIHGHFPSLQMFLWQKRILFFATVLNIYFKSKWTYFV